MPRDPLLPESDSAMRPRCPDAGSGPERKRRRKVLSCYDCRRRKLQCDRIMPACGRCTKAGLAANCLYIDEGTDTPIRNGDPAALANAEFSKGPFEGHFTRPILAQPAPTAPPHDTLARLEFQDRRIKQLESALLQPSMPPAASPLHHIRQSQLPLSPDSHIAVENTTTPHNVIDRETMLLRGKSFKTHFCGITHPGSLIAYIPELNTFTKDTFAQFPGLQRIRHDMKAFEHKMPYEPTDTKNVSHSDLLALLPSRPETDSLVQLYLDNYDCIYHILYLPTFRRDYDAIWTDSQQCSSHFIALVLLMTAAAQCLEITEPWLYTAGSSTAREKAVTIIAMCERWLESQSQKHITCADFQIRFLINLAKLVNVVKLKRIWTDAGTMLRFFMSAGLHRNPDLLRKPTSALDKEMRRRLWAAASEFELQAAFARGMISAPFPQQSDCPPPSNINDEDLEPSSEISPPCRPLSAFTTSAYLAVARESFNLRYSLNSLLNNIRQTVSFEDAKRYTEEVDACIASIPDWTSNPASAAPHALLTINLRNCILVLHDRQFRLAKSQAERDFAKITILNTASKIMEAHKRLTDGGCRALQLLCHDQTRTALSVCHIAFTPDPHASSILTNLVDETASEVIADVCDHVSDKVTRYGTEQRQLWIALAANAFMETRKDPERKLFFMQEAVERITRPYYKIMACQEDLPATQPDVNTNGVKSPGGNREHVGTSMEQSNGATDYRPLPNGAAGIGIGGVSEAQVFDPALVAYDDLAAWTFDDWNFDPGDMGAGFDGMM